jgi:hypothetical protein
VREPLALENQQATDTFAQTSSHKDLLGVWDSYTNERSKAQGRFQSQAVACREYSEIRFEVAGALRSRGMELSLQPVAGGRETPIRQPLFGNSEWTAVSVRCPSGPFTVVATDASPTAWFAFRQPAEIGWASSVAESMIQQSWTFGAAAALLVMWASSGALTRRRNEVNGPPPSI